MNFRNKKLQSFVAKALIFAQLQTAFGAFAQAVVIRIPLDPLQAAITTVKESTDLQQVAPNQTISLSTTVINDTSTPQTLSAITPVNGLIVESSSCSIGDVLAPNDTCSFDFSINTGTTPGTWSRGLALTMSSDAQSSQIWAYQYTATLATSPILSAIPATLSVPAKGSVSSVITNPYPYTINLGTLLANPSSLRFKIARGSCGYLLAPNSSCTVSVSKNTSGAATQPSSTTLTLNGSSSVPLAQIPMALADLTPPTFSALQDTAGWSTDRSQYSTTYKITNTSTVVLGSLQATLNDPTNAFSVSSNTCSSDIAPSQSCYITFSAPYTALPTSNISFQATISNFYVSNTLTVSLDNTPKIASVQIDPTSYTYPDTPSGQSNMAAFNITSTGNIPATPTQITTTSQQYAIVSNNCSTIAPSDSCQVVVEFKPHVRGLTNAQLQVSLNNQVAAVSSLYGTGLAAQIDATPSTIFFTGALNTYYTQTVTLKNTGNVSTLITSTALPQPNGTWLSTPSNLCKGTTLEPDQSCTITYKARSAQADQTASLVVAYTNSATTTTVPIQGVFNKPAASFSVSEPACQVRDYFVPIPSYTDAQNNNLIWSGSCALSITNAYSDNGTPTITPSQLIGLHTSTKLTTVALYQGSTLVNASLPLDTPVEFPFGARLLATIAHRIDQPAAGRYTYPVSINSPSSTQVVNLTTTLEDTFKKQTISTPACPTTSTLYQDNLCSMTYQNSSRNPVAILSSVHPALPGAAQDWTSPTDRIATISSDCLNKVVAPGATCNAFVKYNLATPVANKAITAGLASNYGATTSDGSITATKPSASLSVSQPLCQTPYLTQAGTCVATLTNNHSTSSAQLNIALSSPSAPTTIANFTHNCPNNQLAPSSSCSVSWSFTKSTTIAEQLPLLTTATYQIDTRSWQESVAQAATLLATTPYISANASCPLAFAGIPFSCTLTLTNPHPLPIPITSLTLTPATLQWTTPSSIPANSSVSIPLSATFFEPGTTSFIATTTTYHTLTTPFSLTVEKLPSSLTLSVDAATCSNSEKFVPIPSWTTSQNLEQQYHPSSTCQVQLANHTNSTIPFDLTKVSYSSNLQPLDAPARLTEVAPGTSLTWTFYADRTQPLGTSNAHFSYVLQDQSIATASFSYTLTNPLLHVSATVPTCTPTWALQPATANCVSTLHNDSSTPLSPASLQTDPSTPWDASFAVCLDVVLPGQSCEQPFSLNPSTLPAGTYGTPFTFSFTELGNVTTTATATLKPWDTPVLSIKNLACATALVTQEATCTATVALSGQYANIGSATPLNFTVSIPSDFTVIKQPSCAIHGTPVSALTEQQSCQLSFSVAANTTIGTTPLTASLSSVIYTPANATFVQKSQSATITTLPPSLDISATCAPSTLGTPAPCTVSLYNKSPLTAPITTPTFSNSAFQLTSASPPSLAPNSTVLLNATALPVSIGTHFSSVSFSSFNQLVHTSVSTQISLPLSSQMLTLSTPTCTPTNLYFDNPALSNAENAAAHYTTACTSYVTNLTAYPIAFSALNLYKTEATSYVSSLHYQNIPLSPLASQILQPNQTVFVEHTIQTTQPSLTIDLNYRQLDNSITSVSTPLTLDNPYDLLSVSPISCPVAYAGIPNQYCQATVTNASTFPLVLTGTITPNLPNYTSSATSCTDTPLQAQTSCTLFVQIPLSATPADNETPLTSGITHLAGSLPTSGATQIKSWTPSTLSMSPLVCNDSLIGASSTCYTLLQNTNTVNPDYPTAGTINLSLTSLNTAATITHSCLNNTLAPQESCHAALTIPSTSPGPKTATLLVDYTTSTLTQSQQGATQQEGVYTVVPAAITLSCPTFMVGVSSSCTIAATHASLNDYLPNTTATITGLATPKTFAWGSLSSTGISETVPLTFTSIGDKSLTVTLFANGTSVATSPLVVQVIPQPVPLKFTSYTCQFAPTSLTPASADCTALFLNASPYPTSVQPTQITTSNTDLVLTDIKRTTATGQLAPSIEVPPNGQLQLQFAATRKTTPGDHYTTISIAHDLSTWTNYPTLTVPNTTALIKFVRTALINQLTLSPITCPTIIIAGTPGTCSAQVANLSDQTVQVATATVQPSPLTPEITTALNSCTNPLLPQQTCTLAIPFSGATPSGTYQLPLSVNFQDVPGQLTSNGTLSLISWTPTGLTLSPWVCTTPTATQPGLCTAKLSNVNKAVAGTTLGQASFALSFTNADNLHVAKATALTPSAACSKQLLNPQGSCTLSLPYDTFSAGTNTAAVLVKATIKTNAQGIPQEIASNAPLIAKAPLLSFTPSSCASLVNKPALCTSTLTNRDKVSVPLQLSLKPLQQLNTPPILSFSATTTLPTTPLLTTTLAPNASIKVILSSTQATPGTYPFTLQAYGLGALLTTTATHNVSENAPPEIRSSVVCPASVTKSQNFTCVLTLKNAGATTATLSDWILKNNTNYKTPTAPETTACTTLLAAKSCTLPVYATATTTGLLTETLQWSVSNDTQTRVYTKTQDMATQASNVTTTLTIAAPSLLALNTTSNNIAHITFRNPSPVSLSNLTIQVQSASPPPVDFSFEPFNSTCSTSIAPDTSCSFDVLLPSNTQGVQKLTATVATHLSQQTAVATYLVDAPKVLATFANNKQSITVPNASDSGNYIVLTNVSKVPAQLTTLTSPSSWLTVEFRSNTATPPCQPGKTLLPQETCTFFEHTARPMAPYDLMTNLSVQLNTSSTWAVLNGPNATWKNVYNIQALGVYPATPLITYDSSAPTITSSFKTVNLSAYPASNLQIKLPENVQQTTTCPTTLAPNEECSTTWTATPATLSQFGSLPLQLLAQYPQVVNSTPLELGPLTTQGFNQVALSSYYFQIDWNTISFQDIEAGTVAVQTLTSTNNSSTALQVQGITVTEPDQSSNFSVLSTTCEDIQLAIGASCQSVIAYIPHAANLSSTADIALIATEGTSTTTIAANSTEATNRPSVDLKLTLNHTAANPYSLINPSEGTVSLTLLNESNKTVPARLAIQLQGPASATLSNISADTAIAYNWGYSSWFNQTQPTISIQTLLQAAGTTCTSSLLGIPCTFASATSSQGLNMPPRSTITLNFPYSMTTQWGLSASAQVLSDTLRDNDLSNNSASFHSAPNPVDAFIGQYGQGTPTIALRLLTPSATLKPFGQSGNPLLDAYPAASANPPPLPPGTYQALIPINAAINQQAWQHLLDPINSLSLTDSVFLPNVQAAVLADHYQVSINPTGALTPLPLPSALQYGAQTQFFYESVVRPGFSTFLTPQLAPFTTDTKSPGIATSRTIQSSILEQGTPSSSATWVFESLDGLIKGPYVLYQFTLGSAPGSFSVNITPRSSLTNSHTETYPQNNTALFSFQGQPSVDLSVSMPTAFPAIFKTTAVNQALSVPLAFTNAATAPASATVVLTATYNASRKIAFQQTSTLTLPVGTSTSVFATTLLPATASDTFLTWTAALSSSSLMDPQLANNTATVDQALQTKAPPIVSVQMDSTPQTPGALTPVRVQITNPSELPLLTTLQASLMDQASITPPDLFVDNAGATPFTPVPLTIAPNSSSSALLYVKLPLIQSTSWTYKLSLAQDEQAPPSTYFTISTNSKWPLVYLPSGQDLAIQFQQPPTFTISPANTLNTATAYVYNNSALPLTFKYTASSQNISDLSIQCSALEVCDSSKQTATIPAYSSLPLSATYYVSSSLPDGAPVSLKITVLNTTAYVIDTDITNDVASYATTISTQVPAIVIKTVSMPKQPITYHSITSESSCPSTGVYVSGLVTYQEKIASYNTDTSPQRRANTSVLCIPNPYGYEISEFVFPASSSTTHNATPPTDWLSLTDGSWFDALAMDGTSNNPNIVLDLSTNPAGTTSFFLYGQNYVLISHTLYMTYLTDGLASSFDYAQEAATILVEIPPLTPPGTSLRIPTGAGYITLKTAAGGPILF